MVLGDMRRADRAASDALTESATTGGQTPVFDSTHRHRIWSLDTMITGLKYTEKAAEIASVPYLKGCIGLTLSIAETCQTVRNNREDCKMLLERIDQLLEALKIDGGRDENTKNMTHRTLKALQEIEPFIKKLATQKRWKFFMAAAVREQILRHTDNVDNILSIFNTHVSAKMSAFIDARQQPYATLSERDVNLISKWRQPFKGWSFYKGRIVQENALVIVLAQKANQDERGIQEFIRVIDRLRREWWKPNLPQFLGATSQNATTRFIALRGPMENGNPNARIAELATMTPLEGSRRLITAVKGLLTGASYALEFTEGRSALTEYGVYVDAEGQLVVHNFELLLGSNMNDPQLHPDDWRHWDGFLQLFTKVLTNEPYLKHHVRGQIDVSRAKVMSFVKHLVEFVADYANTLGDRVWDPQSPALTAMLAELENSLNVIQERLDEMSPSNSGSPLVATLTSVSEKLSGIWDFAKGVAPQVHIGDFGYMAGTPEEPNFVKLTNVAGEISEVCVEVKTNEPLLYRPSSLNWTEDVVDGVTRHTCDLTDAPPHDTLIRVERGMRSETLAEKAEDGTLRKRWGSRRLWKWFLENKEMLVSRFADHQAHELLLVISTKQSDGHGMIRLTSNTLTFEERQESFRREGFNGDKLYFFENREAREGELWGYWSCEPQPGHPIWPPSIDSAGQPWMWDTRTEFYRVEVSRNFRFGPHQHMRFLHF